MSVLSFSFCCKWFWQQTGRKPPLGMSRQITPEVTAVVEVLSNERAYDYAEKKKERCLLVTGGREWRSNDRIQSIRHGVILTSWMYYKPFFKKLLSECLKTHTFLVVLTVLHINKGNMTQLSSNSVVAGSHTKVLSLHHLICSISLT